MKARLNRWLTFLLLLALGAGCSGSGSSGFDDVPGSEGAAITLALETQRCVPYQAFTICPADRTAASGGNERIDTDLAGAPAITCAGFPSDRECSFTVAFTPSGFPLDATYRVAVRGVMPDGPWSIGEALSPVGAPGAPDWESPVTVQPPQHAPAGGGSVQLAILVFLEPPAGLPASVTNLSDTGADFAFVTTERAILDTP